MGGGTRRGVEAGVVAAEPLKLSPPQRLRLRLGKLLLARAGSLWTLRWWWCVWWCVGALATPNN